MQAANAPNPSVGNEEPFTQVLELLKTLADESRLRIIGILADRSRSVEEIATLLDLTPPTISHHLARLRQMELVTLKRDGNTHLYRLNREALHRLSRELLPPSRLPGMADLDGEAWERKVLRDFFAGERLTVIPSSRKKRLVVLKWLAEQFETGRTYTEAEVNEIIGRHHPDTATLRRELIMNRFMDRRPEGVYWRTPERARTEP